MFTRRQFLGTSSASALGAAATGPARGTEGRSAALLRRDPGHPAPATYDRLPLEWHQATVKRFQEKLLERGLDGALITDPWNIIYFTGLFHTTTERPFACFIPARDRAQSTGSIPASTRNSSTPGGSTTGTLLRLHPRRRGIPHQGRLQMGAASTSVVWQLRGVGKRGFGDKAIGVARVVLWREPSERMRAVFQGALEEVGDALMKMRRVKTPEELALSQRAYNYFSQIHAFTRDYILQHGTDLTDYKIANAAKQFGTDLVLKDIKRDGHPHTAVGISIGSVAAREWEPLILIPTSSTTTGLRRATPQVAGGVKIGGCGGELYRPYQIAPWKPEWEKIWEVMAQGSRMQIELSTAGTPCQ